MLSYEGKEDYIFISYSHQNENQVMPVVSRLLKDGYRVWYDEGIDPGTEWPEIVATHLRDCALFLAFISTDYINSFNCKREIDYAVSKRKPFVAVILEEVEMSPGMEMQLASVQFLNKHKMEETVFFERLYQSELLKPCLSDSRADDSTGVAGDESGRKVTRSANRSDVFPLFRSIRTEGVSHKRLSRERIAAMMVGALAAAGLVYLIAWNVTHINIAGTTYMINDEGLSIEGATLTPADTRKLSRFVNLGFLSFESCDFTEDSENNIGSIKEGVRSLHLVDCTGIDNFGFLSSEAFNSVKWLEVNNCGFDDADLTDLIRFDFDTEDLIGATLSNNKDFSNLGGFIDAFGNRIESLHIANTSVFSLSPLKDCESLCILDFDGCDVDSLEPLGALGGLEDIRADNNKLRSLKGLEKATLLSTISAAGNELDSIAAIADCSVLERVDLSNNKLDDVSPLEKSRDTVTKLLLDNNEISNMIQLRGMRSLEVLSMDGNALEDLSFLEGSDELRVLSARNNRISHAEVLSELRGLDSLYLSGNKLEGKIEFGYKLGSWNQDSAGKGGVRNIQLQHNNITSIEFNGTAPYSLAAYDNPLVNISGKYDAGSTEETESTKGQAVFKTGGKTIVIDDYEEHAERRGSLGDNLSKVYLSWDSSNDDMLSMVSNFNEYTHLSVSGCPLDYHSQIETLISDVSYTTTDQMDEILDEERKECFDLYR